MEGKKQPYMFIFGALAVLTVVEVGVAFIGLPRTLTIWVLVFLAVWKGRLGALYFMHLKFEPVRLVLLAAAPLPLPFVLVLIVLVEYAR